MKTVVLTDSQIVLKRMLRFAMELQGYRVVDTDDAAGAQAALAGDHCDLLVAGVYPDREETRALISAVRCQPQHDSLPILLVGEPQLRADWDLRAIGTCAWLDKPFRMGELHALVESLLRGMTLPPSRPAAQAG